MSTLGNNANETSVDPASANFLFLVGPYTAPENGTINSIRFKADGNGTGGTSQVLRGAVLLDAAGEPDTLVCRGAEVTVLNLDAAAVLVSAGAGEAIVSGSAYWIGFEAGATSQAARFFYSSHVGAARFKALTYPTIPSPIGASSSLDERIEAWIDYTPAAAGTHTGSLAGRLEFQGEIVVENAVSGGGMLLSGVG